MTEHLNKSDLKIDKTTTRIGEGEGYRWELHALPEYVESDVALSEQVTRGVSALLKQKGIKNLTVDLTEGYDEEKLGMEHYRLHVLFGEGNEGKKNYVFKTL